MNKANPTSPEESLTPPESRPDSDSRAPDMSAEETPAGEERSAGSGARDTDARADEALEVRAAVPGDTEARDAFVLAHPRSTFFHQSGWQRFVTNVHRHRSEELLAWRGEELVGVLPLMSCSSLSGRRKLLSLPFSVYGGPLGADAGVERQLVQAACELAEERRVHYLELRTLEDPAPEWPGSDLYCTFQKELPEDPDEVLKGMPKKARADARKARTKHGLELSLGEWYVDDLCRLFLLNKRALGSPALPAAHFAAALRDFPGQAFVHLVRREGTPLAAVMSFTFRDTLIAYYAGTAPDADRSFKASNFMYMALQEWAVERGFRVFDFCRSRKDSGAFSFKRHQGFEPIPLHYRYHLVRAKAVPNFTPSNPKTAFLRNSWSRLPLWMARRLSDRLARYVA